MASRTHLALEKDAPVPRPMAPRTTATTCRHSCRQRHEDQVIPFSRQQVHMKKSSSRVTRSDEAETRQSAASELKVTPVRLDRGLERLQCSHVRRPWLLEQAVLVAILRLGPTRTVVAFCATWRNAWRATSPPVPLCDARSARIQRTRGLAAGAGHRGARRPHAAVLHADRHWRPRAQ